jgi:transcriptional regulator with XRE-family HTH domain
VEENERDKSNPNAQLPHSWSGAISGLIKEFRLSKGWTQEELGFRSGYAPVYVNLLERGHRNPSVQALINLCQAFGVRPSVFFAEVEKRVGLAGGAAGANGST